MRDILSWIGLFMLAWWGLYWLMWILDAGRGYTSRAEALTGDAGNLGIGDQSPEARLSVAVLGVETRHGVSVRLPLAVVADDKRHVPAGCVVYAINALCMAPPTMAASGLMCFVMPPVRVPG